MRPLPRICLLVTIDLALVALALEVIPRVVPVPGLQQSDLMPVDAEGSRLGKQPHPYLSFAPSPNWTTTRRNRQAKHNAHGLRGPEVSLRKPARVFRVACLGGSSTYGTGPRSDKATYPARLQQHLRRVGTRAEVLNFGVPGWTTTESLINLSLRVIAFEPDLLIVYHATNDALAALWPNPTPDQTHFRTPWTQPRTSSLERTLERSRLFLIARAYLTDYLKETTDQAHYMIVNQPPSLEEDDLDRVAPPQGIENFTRNLRHMVAIARAEGIPIVLASQGFNPAEGKGSNVNSGQVRFRTQRRLLEAQATLAGELGVPLIDAAAQLEAVARAELEASGTQKIFANNVHLTNHGANLLAQLIAESEELAELLPGR